jgi:hypothetical protein
LYDQAPRRAYRFAAGIQVQFGRHHPSNRPATQLLAEIAEYVERLIESLEEEFR